MRLHAVQDAGDLQLGDFRTITLIVLGRGVGLDGTLSGPQKRRVIAALDLAANLQTQGITVRIIWTGRASRKQISKGTLPAKTEARAMLDYARQIVYPGDIVNQVTEERSTNTVENMTYSHADVLPNSLIIVLTDNLHYKWGRVAFITRLHFPKRAVRYATLGATQAKSLKSELTQIASLVVLCIATIGVRRGDIDAIRRRQQLLNRTFMNRQPTG